MSDNIFQLAGKVNVPAEKRNEVNKRVLKIMDKCGIRKTKEITVAGKKMTVVKPALPNADGIVLFDYSIFEKKKRKISTYNLNTCELYSEDQGYDEFAIVMSMIMVLQEAYTDGGCYFTKSGKPGNIKAYLFLTQGVLGEKITLPGRMRMWEMYLFFRNSEEYANVTYEELVDGYSKSYGGLDLEQFMAVMEVENKKLTFPDKKRISHRNEIKDADLCARTEYAYRVFCSMDETEKNAVKNFLPELLEADLEKRKEMSARQDEKGILAEISLYVLPARLVLAYAQAVEGDFWEIWDSRGIKGYSDIIQENLKDAEEDFSVIPFYKAIQRNDEDEFLEFWDGGNLILSQDMRDCMQRWKKQINSMSVPSDISSERFLAETIIKLERCNCRYVDETFVAEVMEHGNEVNYQKILIFLQQLLDKGLEYFPELTGEQAEEWIIRSARGAFAYTEISGFVSLMTNKRQRNNMFGF